jgi:threonine dehydrogenase-like Zn-dependent dehydrogenase
MKAIIFDGKRARFIEDHLLPVPTAHESLIQVELAAVCATDREILRGYRPDFHEIMGHEFVGITRESNNASLIGQRVVGEINLNCGQCLYCTTGRPHHCSERTTLGINSKDGSFAEFLTLPTSLLHPVPKGLSPEEAVYAEPLAAALRITEQVAFAPAMPVAILGDGRLALMICQALAATTPVALTVFGRHPEKLALFAPYAVTVQSSQAEQKVREGRDLRDEQRLQEGQDPQRGFADNFEVVIDATGSPQALSTALRLTRSEGTLVMKSTYAGRAELDMSEIVVREIRVQGSRCGSFGPALALLQSGRIALPSIELHAPEDFEAAFVSSAFKAGLDFRR